MKLIRDWNALPDDARGGAVAIGNFDGVHIGHAQIMARLTASAREAGGPAVVFTFDPHPAWLCGRERRSPPLTWTERKAELLAELGVDALVAYPTDEALLRLSPDEFFQTIVRGGLRAKTLVEGPNFQFGRGRAGTIDVLRGLCDAGGMSLEIVPPVAHQGEPVSSSRVRHLISAGDVDAAGQLLTRPYRLRGLVTHGAGRGAKLGFPTANLAGVDTLVPGAGVYAGRAYVAGAKWPAAVHIGPLPTFGDLAHKIEVHLIGFQGFLYGQAVEVDFLRRLRDIHPFPNAEALAAQLARDVAAAEAIVAGSKLSPA